MTLLSRLGDPQRHLPPTIHVAGTNGKGSTIAFMRAIFEAAGYGVHVYTSPHLFRYNERFVLNGHIIDDDRLLEGLRHIEALSADLDLGFVEVTAALGFHLFSHNPADVLLLETGLGGRLDHTNLVEAPLLSLITTISYDHTALLGDRIEMIAAEKAGIIKPGIPFIAGHQIYPQVLEVLRARANDCGAPFHLAAGCPPVPLALHGAHQRHNAALAVTAMRVQARFPIDDNAITTGLSRAHWPGRLHPVTWPGIKAGWDLWLDGAHNDSGAAVIADWIAAQDRPVYLITAMRSGKDIDRFTAPLARVAAGIVPILLDGGVDPHVIAQSWRMHGCRQVADPVQTIADGITQITAAHTGGIILVCGSLYLAQLVMPPATG